MYHPQEDLFVTDLHGECVVDPGVVVPEFGEVVEEGTVHSGVHHVHLEVHQNVQHEVSWLRILVPDNMEK